MLSWHLEQRRPDVKDICLTTFGGRKSRRHLYEDISAVLEDQRSNSQGSLLIKIDEASCNGKVSCLEKCLPKKLPKGEIVSTFSIGNCLVRNRDVKRKCQRHQDATSTARVLRPISYLRLRRVNLAKTIKEKLQLAYTRGADELSVTARISFLKRKWRQGRLF